MNPRARSLLFLATCALGNPAAQTAPLHGCATMLEIQRHHAAGTTGARRFALTIAPASLAGRTLRTAHFAINYTVGPNVHQPKWTAADSALRSERDSILATLSPSLSAFKRDSTLHALLDSLGAPHPYFIQRAAAYFERAYAYYHDSLGMTMPNPSTSLAYDVSNPGRFSVDIADIGTVNSEYQGPFYGLTFPPDQGGNILLENDFLYDASYNPGTGVITGDPVTSVVGGHVIDYSSDARWEAGIKVTISHEFYHAVQFGYTPNLGNPHAWYELSAVGMEERLVPELNDYFQYLPYVLLHHETVSLLTPPQSNENYGNGIFHQYLTHVLGRAFDVTVWSALKVNGNNLPAALLTLAGNSQARWDSLYTSFAAAVATAGRTGDSATCTDTTAPIFTRDLPCWPRPTLDNAPTAGTSELNAPAATFRLIRAPSTADTVWADLPGFSGAWRVDKQGSAYPQTFLKGSRVPFRGSTDSSVVALAIANSSFSTAQKFRLSKTAAAYSAYRNPVSRTQDGGTEFLAPAGVTASANLSVLSETGKVVGSVVPDSAGYSWSWNLKDPQGRVVPAGVYFFKAPGLPSKTLLVLP